MSSHDRQRRAAADAPAARIRRPIQARLEVGPVDDPMEVEAEATADRVIAAIQTSGGAPAVAARKAPTEDELKGGGGDPAHDEDEAKRAPVESISRMSGPEEELPAQGYRIARAGGMEDEEPMQGSRTARSSAVGPDGGAVDPELESRLTAGGGAPLPEPVRATMEGAFGADFSAVRVSENPAAAEIGALAYTTGADVRFAPGRFQPGSSEGQHLLAHELTHVVQQGAAPAATARAVAQRAGGPVDPASLNVNDLVGQYHYQFRLFLRKNYAVENIDFIDALDHKMERSALIRTFVAEDAPMMINVSGALRNAVVNGDADPETLRGEIMKGLESQVQPFTQDPQAMATLSM